MMLQVAQDDEVDKFPYDPLVLLNFILDGYDDMCDTAELVTPLVIQLQRDHLENFNLTWLLLNQAMYYRWVYLDFEDLMAECILKVRILIVLS